MQLTLSLSFATGLLASMAAAVDTKACNGVGACLMLSNCNYSGGYDCGSEGTITAQKAAGGHLGFGNSYYEYATAEEFPECDLKQPSETSVLLKNTDGDTIYYAFADYNCAETSPPVTECYNSARNYSYVYVCKVVKNGASCKSTGTVTSPAAC